MKEEELGELLDQLMQAEHFISTFVAGLPTSSPAVGTSSSGDCSASCGAQGGSCEEAGSGLGLELVGRAVTVDPLAAAAAAAAFGPGQEPGELVVLPAGEAAGSAGGLIPAFHPGRQDAQQGVQQGGQPGMQPAASSGSVEQQGGERAEADREAAVGDIEPLAWQELSTSAGSGALSLLLAGSSAGGAGQATKLRQLLAQVPAGADGRLSVDAVARSLGLQHQATVAALQHLFAQAGEATEQGACPSPSADLVASIQPRLPAAEDAAADGTTDSSSGGPAEKAHTFSLEQAERGVSRLLQLLAHSCGSTAASTSGRAEQQPTSRRVHKSTASAPADPQPTSKQYWQARADAVLPPSVARAWALLERQATQQFAVLQGRTATADEVCGQAGLGWCGEMEAHSINRLYHLPSAFQNIMVVQPFHPPRLSRCCHCARRTSG